MTTAELPRTIRATVSPAAIAKVPDFFNATTADILSELLQNSRRSGATAVAVTKADHLITISDDGRGISDPQALLAFGRSNWDRPTDNENPAGMGIYSLARAGDVTIRSRTRGNPAWQVVLSAEHFTGADTADIETLDRPGPDDPGPGTSVTFTHRPETHTTFETTLQKASRHYPLPVTLDEEPLRQYPFLQDALQTERWHGIDIGVHARRTAGGATVNFHGVTVDHRNLPEIACLDGAWSATIDVIDSPELRLTLPARKELVETPFMDDVRRACTLAIYRAMLTHPAPVDVPKSVQDDARRLGIILPDARPQLPPWKPERADDYDCDPADPPVPAGRDSLLLTAELSTADQQAVFRMAETHGIQGRLLTPEPALEGYAWYDSLTRIERVTTLVRYGRKTFNLRRMRRSGDAPSPDRPDTIRIVLQNAQGQKPHFRLNMTTDMVILDENHIWINSTLPLVTKDSELTPHLLSDLLMDSLFQPSDDSGADSYDTQKQFAHEECQRLALLTLMPRNDAIAATIEKSIRRHVIWDLPPGTNATISIRRDDPATLSPQITVQLHVPAEIPPPDPTPPAQD